MVEKEAFEVVIFVIVVGPLDVLQVLYEGRSNAIADPLPLCTLSLGLTGYCATKLSFEVLHLLEGEVVDVLAVGNMSAAVDDFAPIKGGLFVRQII